MLVLILSHPLLFLSVFVLGGLVGAAAFRKNPLKGAKTLDEIETMGRDFIAKEKAAFKAKFGK
jgi:hypothetical protein